MKKTAKRMDLLTELDTHNEFFDSLVNMIPVKLYVSGASGDDAYNPKYLKGQHKESKEARKARNKLAKSAKFAPDKETTIEMKKRIQREQDEISDSSENDVDDIIMSDGDGEEEQEGVRSSTTTYPVAPPDASSEPSYASRIEALRAKLHKKMAEKRAAAGINPDDTEGAEVDTSAPQLVSKRAARRAEKRKRKEAAMQRNKRKTTSTAESKKTEQKRVVNVGGSATDTPANTKSTKHSPADDLATIDYQSIAGLKPKLESGNLDNKSLGGGKKKSLEKLLADAERKQQRLKELKESAREEDREKAKSIEWGETLKVAGGTHSAKTNDPKLIKKAMKRKAKKKAASAKAWGARLDQDKDAASKKQQIRSHNLDSRKQGGAKGANLSSKRIVEHDDKEQKKERRRMGPHSGKNRAGFEGKKQGFLNSTGGGS